MKNPLAKYKKTAVSVSLFVGTAGKGLSLKERVSNAWKLNLTCGSIGRIFGWTDGATRKRVMEWRKEDPDQFPIRPANAPLVNL